MNLVNKHFFRFDGMNSADFGAYIAIGNIFDGAERDVESVEIPGRNGTLTLDNHRYHNLILTLTVYVPSQMRRHVDALRGYLQSRDGYCKLEDTLHPEEYRLARFAGFVVTESDRKGASIDITFDCKPQRFLRSGDRAITYTVKNNNIVVNRTYFTAKPLIRCYGASGTLTVNGVKVTVSGCTSYVDIDCDLMEAYEGETSRNSKTVLDSGAFPKLVPGNNTVSFTGFSRIAITPRWFMI